MVAVATTRRKGAYGLVVGIVLALCSSAFAVGEGALAPEIALKDRSGKLVRIAELKGHVVVVDFWASWCAPCREELPVLDALYRKYRDRGLIVIGVGQDKDAANVAKFLRASPLTFPVVHDPDGAVANRYAPPKMPSSYVLDKQGLIRYVHAGFRASDRALLERELNQLLAQQ